MPFGKVTAYFICLYFASSSICCCRFSIIYSRCCALETQTVQELRALGARAGQRPDQRLPGAAASLGGRIMRAHARTL